MSATLDDGDVLFLTIARSGRASIATTIERLINMLDELDGDIDFEPDADGEDNGDFEPDVDGEDGGDREPSLGAPERVDWYVSQARWADGAPGDHEREVVSEDEGACIQSQPHDMHDEGNDEPWLGFTGIGTGWREGDGLLDFEEDHDGREPEPEYDGHRLAVMPDMSAGCR